MALCECPPIGIIGIIVISWPTDVNQFTFLIYCNYNSMSAGNLTTEKLFSYLFTAEYVITNISTSEHIDMWKMNYFSYVYPYTVWCPDGWVGGRAEGCGFKSRSTKNMCIIPPLNGKGNEDISILSSDGFETWHVWDGTSSYFLQ